MVKGVTNPKICNFGGKLFCHVARIPLPQTPEKVTHNITGVVQRTRKNSFFSERKEQDGEEKACFVFLFDLNSKWSLILYMSIRSSNWWAMFE